MQKNSIQGYSVCFFLLILLSMAGCNKFKGDQEVPAYIQIDNIIISKESADKFGLAPSAKIVDVWISVDGWKIGGYQLPCTIPVLKRGEHKVLIEAGILVNNMSGRRGIYPFYSGKELTLNFVEDSILHIGSIEVDISNSYKYVFKEDFEIEYKHGFDTVAGYHSAPLKIKRCNTLPFSTPDLFYGECVGLIHLGNGDSSGCCIFTKEIFSKENETAFPYNQPIFIEVDYLTNNIFEVGIVSYPNNKPYFHPVVIVGSQRNPEWSKVYVDISNAVTSQLYEDKDAKFKIFIRANLEDDNQEANIYLDNIRVVFAKK